jgi:NAD(P)-dependent dehydrogenase (short-subunit alcohol dehydrogenase family)
MRVVITGASRGLGLELTRQHLARGDEVFATARRPSSALSALSTGRLTVFALDVTHEAQLAEAARQCPGPVDALWANAGVYPGSPGTDVDEGRLGTLKAQEGLEILNVNALGAVLTVQAFLPKLLQARAPRALAISSGYGSLSLNQGTPYWYGASKAALNMLFRSLAFDPAAKGLLTAVVSPGWAQTDMGGVNAPQPVDETVRGLVSVLDGMTREQ